jgi:hypothetical protein
MRKGRGAGFWFVQIAGRLSEASCITHSREGVASFPTSRNDNSNELSLGTLPFNPKNGHGTCEMVHSLILCS